MLNCFSTSMGIATTRFGALKNMIEGSVISSKNTTYHCCHIDEMSVVFSQSEGTGKVMLPTDVVLEWISAYEFGVINIGMSAREMRNEMKLHSEWAPYQHGFETHLNALVHAWASRNITGIE